MEYNYHTHTARCRHASGTAEEYIENAIRNGIKYMGFSDHVPLKFPDGSESGYRVPTSQGKEYCDEIRALAEKYKDKIDIRIGFEMEHYPLYFNEMLQNAIDYGAEYLILGQHFTGDDNGDGFYSGQENENSEELKKYTELIISAMQSGVYTYLAHPDLFNYEGDMDLYWDEMRKICVASRKYNVPLEINFLGIRDNRKYPREKFWEIAGEEQSPVTFGFDAHDAKAAYDGESLKVAEEMVRKYNLNYIGAPELVLINKE